jgi:hypothetical protein
VSAIASRCPLGAIALQSKRHPAAGAAALGQSPLALHVKQLPLKAIKRAPRFGCVTGIIASVTQERLLESYSLSQKFTVLSAFLRMMQGFKLKTLSQLITRKIVIK